MEKGSQINIIHQMNSLRSGINFIIPSYCWEQLLEKNRNNSDFSMVEYLDEHPLKSLYEMDLLQICFQEIEKQTKQLQNQLQSCIKTIDNQFKEIKRKEGQRLSFKRSHSDVSWHKKRPEFNRFNKQFSIISPQIKLQQYDSIFDNSKWMVVSPDLYKNICQNKYVTSDKNQSGKLIGIPVFLKQINGCIESTYTIKERIFASLYFQNLQKKDYSFIGYIEPLNSFSQFMNEIYLVFQKLSLQFNQQIPVSKRNKIYCIKNHFYYNFEDYDKVHKDLPWEHYKKIEQYYLNSINHLKMVEISSYSDEIIQNIQNPMKIIEEDTKQFRGKKIKQHQGFHYHDSTEGETQQQKTQKSFKFQKMNGKERFEIQMERIPYKILKKDYNIAGLLKSSKQNMRKCIEIPLSNEDNRMNIAQNKNIKYILDKSCNKIKLNASNQYQQIFQEQKQDSQNNNKQIPKQMVIWLETMSLTVLKPQVFNVVQKVQREEMSENMKEKLQFESQTQKMQQVQDPLSSEEL